ncbi:uncharacterized protein [Haliotis asinina]|uniref:uncharacterized protein n=1 Tax=Haliotis asinina TaxID=109174 RepID=UPI003531E242
MFFIWLLLCCGSVLCQGIETSPVHIVNEPGNWWEAQSRCKDNGTMLYTPGTDVMATELVKNLRIPTESYYWIGAMSYRAWQWTVDRSPLFTYAGFLPVLNETVEMNRTFLDNSVWKCHLHCSPSNSVGMKGTMCYCLGEGYQTTNTRTPEDTCPGNLEERCGNIQGMSVYKLENMTFYQEENTDCAYMRDTDCSIHADTLNNCKTASKCYACFALSGATTDINCGSMKSWCAANKACHLVKLNESALSSLLGSRDTNTTFWIGLYRYLERRWINGDRTFSYDGHRGALSSDTWCLSVYKQRGQGMRLYWRPCSEKRPFICEDDILTSSPTITSTPSPRPSSPSPTLTTTSASTTVTNHTGVFTGLGVGCVLLLTVPIVVCLLRRHKKLCFKKRDGNQRMHFTSAAENITHGLDGHAQTESKKYAAITPCDTKDGTPAKSTVPTAIGQPNVHSDNIHTSQINDENEYNVLSTSNNSKVVVQDENPYNHLPGPDGRFKYKRDYDIANFVIQTEGITGRKNSAGLPELRSGQIFEEEHYNVLGQHDSPRTVDAVARVYDHVIADEGDYDTARWGKNVSKVNDSYSHTHRTTKPIRD